MYYLVSSWVTPTKKASREDKDETDDFGGGPCVGCIEDIEVNESSADVIDRGKW